MSAPNYVELARSCSAGRRSLGVDRLLDDYDPVGWRRPSPRIGARAYHDYGRGSHPARLSLGDTYSYAGPGQGVLRRGDDRIPISGRVP